MSSRRLKQLQQAYGQKKEDGDGDAMSYDTSRWPSPSTHTSDSPQPEYEDCVNLLLDGTPNEVPSVKCQVSTQSKGKKDNKVQGPQKQKTNTAQRQTLKLPPMKPPQVSKPVLQPADLNCYKDLKNQVRDLQQQLSEARTENKLMKKLHHRHTVALQQFQDSEGSIEQILTKHNNETRVLEGQLRETRASRDSLARQLQATENKLLKTKASLQHLQLLQEDQGLLEREELTMRLAKATAELEEKDMRIVDMKKNLELCQASFNRQLITEQRKVSEANKKSCYLQEQIYQLTKEIQDRECELEKHNICSHRFLKSSARKNKIIQTDELVLLSANAASPLETEYSDTDKKLEQQESPVKECCYSPVQEPVIIKNQEKQVSANLTRHQEDSLSLLTVPAPQTASQEENHQESTVGGSIAPSSWLPTTTITKEQEQDGTETYADTSDEESCSEQNPENQTESECAQENEPSEVPQVLEEQTTVPESEVAILEKSPHATERKESKIPKIRCSYTIKHSKEDTHRGRPARDKVACRSTKSMMTVETLGSGIRQLHLSGGKSRRCGVNGSH